MSKSSIVILGGGLSGLTTAYLLEKEGYSSTILEARNRLGGRIYTLRNNSEPPIEMGATWLGKKHTHLISLLEKLGIDIFEQFMGEKAYYEYISTSPPQLVQLPHNEDPTYRISGGSDHLINVLRDQLDHSDIHLNQPAGSIEKQGDALIINSRDKQLDADFVISTLPPKLFNEQISVTPSLPSALIQKASQTHTWMAESIKVGLTYQQPFWRDSGTSGTIMSNVGPITEMYDHSDEESSRFALKGFLNEAYHSLTRKERLELTLDQLEKYYGSQSKEFTSYQELVWKNEPYTHSEYDRHIIPHQHNGDLIFRKSYLDGRLLISGSETASEFPGYMDGAVESAHHAVNKIKERLS